MWNMWISFNWNWNTTETLQKHYKHSSSIIRCLTGLGKVLSQTWDTLVILATLESSWATLLPSLFRWWKEHQLNEEEASLIFWMMCPSSPPKTPSLIAWIMDKASDSIITCVTSISIASSTPSRTAIASEISAVKDARRTLLEAARISPLLPQMTTLMHKFLSSSDVAASVLTLKKPKEGAFHLDRGGAWGKTRLPWTQPWRYLPFPRLEMEESQNPHGLLDCDSTKLTKQQQRKVLDHSESLSQ